MKHIFNHIYKYLILSTLFLASYSNTNAQETQSTFWQQVQFGGGIGLGFGNGFFSGTMAPSVIYNFSDQFALGIGLNATYAKRNDYHKSTILGGSIISLFNPFDRMQLSAEFEELNVNRKFDDRLNLTDQNYWYPALFLGAGYRNGNVVFGIRYDVLYDEDKSIYVDPWMPFVRFYF